MLTTMDPQCEVESITAIEFVFTTIAKILDKHEKDLPPVTINRLRAFLRRNTPLVERCLKQTDEDLSAAMRRLQEYTKD